MAGENTGETPEGNEIIRQLTRIADAAEGIRGGMDLGVKALAKYGPALDRAAALANSPAARLVGKVRNR
jgi:hypothetical protein